MPAPPARGPGDPRVSGTGGAQQRRGSWSVQRGCTQGPRSVWWHTGRFTRSQRAPTDRAKVNRYRNPHNDGEHWTVDQLEGKAGGEGEAGRGFRQDLKKAMPEARDQTGARTAVPRASSRGPRGVCAVKASFIMILSFIFFTLLNALMLCRGYETPKTPFQDTTEAVCTLSCFKMFPVNF